MISARNYITYKEIPGQARNDGIPAIRRWFNRLPADGSTGSPPGSPEPLPHPLLHNPPQPFMTIRIHGPTTLGTGDRGGEGGGVPLDVGGDEGLAAVGASDDDLSSNHCMTL